MSELPDVDRAKRTIGLILYLAGMAVGGLLLLGLFLLAPILEYDFGTLGSSGAKPVYRTAGVYADMCLGALLAFPAAILYLTVPRLLDRYDPEPWYSLLACVLWGGIAACGFSGSINTLVAACSGQLGGAALGHAVGAVVSAPLAEEFFKGIAVWGVFFFLRREFDGIVDGVIYATFTAIGFATVENAIYYARAAAVPGELTSVFLLRGVLGPWGHPLYTSMIGIGFGLAREIGQGGTRYLAPVTGYLAAVFLHSLWNGTALVASSLGSGGALLFVSTLPLWLFFILFFLGIIVFLVRRRGQVIRQYLEDEVAIGTISRAELELTASAFGLFRVRMQHGQLGVDFVRAAARLALSKWHATRAARNATQTQSIEFVVPLRRRIAELKAEVGRRPAR
ncbi:MAG: PrsW family intramembrane metalloprotease [Myxococcota bacterium]